MGTAVVLVLVGAADGFAQLFGGRWWLGALVVGVGTLVLLALGVFIGMRTWQSRWRQQRCNSMTNASSSNMRHSDTALLTEPQKKRHYNTDDERVFHTASR